MYEDFDKLTDEQKLNYIEQQKNGTHYKNLEVKGVLIEPNDIIEAMAPHVGPSVKWYTDNIIKYALRFPFKGQETSDLEKIRDYANLALKKLNKNSVMTDTPIIDSRDLNDYLDLGVELGSTGIISDFFAINDFHALDVRLLTRDDAYIGKLRANHFCVEVGYLEENRAEIVVLVTANHKGDRETEMYTAEATPGTRAKAILDKALKVF